MCSSSIPSEGLGVGVGFGFVVSSVWEDRERRTELPRTRREFGFVITRKDDF